MKSGSLIHPSLAHRMLLLPMMASKNMQNLAKTAGDVYSVLILRAMFDLQEGIASGFFATLSPCGSGEQLAYYETLLKNM